MDSEKDLKDNQPRRSKWLMYCVPMMILAFSAIFLIPLGIFYLKPHLHEKRIAALHANKMVQLAATPSAFPVQESAAPSGSSPPNDIALWKLPSSWCDSLSANPFLPRLDQDWQYGKRPVHGVVLNGWLHLNNTITPGIGRNEAGWSAKLSSTPGGRQVLKDQLEQHYQEFLSEADFAEIAESGLDHVKIPIGYWALQAPPQDPHMSGAAWRYFVRGLEWARKYGLRVCVSITSDDAIPFEFLDQVVGQFSKFLAQKRYQRLVTMLEVATPSSCLGASSEVYKTIQGAGFKGIILGRDVEQIFQFLPRNNARPQQRLATVCSWQTGNTRSAQLVEWNLDDGGQMGDATSPLYRAYLKDFAKGQIAVFDAMAWGWFHSSWKGGDMRQSYQRGIEAAVLPNLNATGPAVEFKCDASTDYVLQGLY